jgi:hypothetical protein
VPANAAIASSNHRRSPSAETPMSLRSASVSRGGRSASRCCHVDRRGGRLGRRAEPQADVATRHVRKASARKIRSVWRDVRWRWTLNVLWTAA